MRIDWQMLAAVLAGVVAAGGMLLLRGGDGGEGEAVVVAQRAVARGDVVTADDLGVANALLGDAQRRQVFGADEQEQLVGAISAHQLAPGQVVSRSAVWEGAVLAAGEYAATIKVDDQRVWRALRPGDVVTITATGDDPERPGATRTIVLAASARVLATLYEKERRLNLTIALPRGGVALLTIAEALSRDTIQVFVEP